VGTSRSFSSRPITHFGASAHLDRKRLPLRIPVASAGKITPSGSLMSKSEDSRTPESVTISYEVCALLGAT